MAARVTGVPAVCRPSSRSTLSRPPPRAEAARHAALDEADVLPAFLDDEIAVGPVHGHKRDTHGPDNGGCAERSRQAECQCRPAADLDGRARLGLQFWLVEADRAKPARRAFQRACVPHTMRDHRPARAARRMIPATSPAVIDVSDVEDVMDARYRSVRRPGLASPAAAQIAQAPRPRFETRPFWFDLRQLTDVSCCDVISICCATGIRHFITCPGPPGAARAERLPVVRMLEPAR